MTFFSAVWNSFRNILTFREISAAVFAYGKKEAISLSLLEESKHCETTVNILEAKK